MKVLNVLSLGALVLASTANANAPAEKAAISMYQLVTCELAGKPVVEQPSRIDVYISHWGEGRRDAVPGMIIAEIPVVPNDKLPYHFAGSATVTYLGRYAVSVSGKVLDEISIEIPELYAHRKPKSKVEITVDGRKTDFLCTKTGPFND